MKAFLLVFSLVSFNAQAMTEKECFQFAHEQGKTLNDLNGMNKIDSSEILGEKAEPEVIAMYSDASIKTENHFDASGILRFTEFKKMVKSKKSSITPTVGGIIHLAASILRICSFSSGNVPDPVCQTFCYRDERQVRDN